MDLSWCKSTSERVAGKSLLFCREKGTGLTADFSFRMVRELFVMAREHAPSIIFMDEIDSIGSSRGEGGSGGGDSEVQRTMLELLNQLDGFEGTKNIKVGYDQKLRCRLGTDLFPFDRSSWQRIESISWTVRFSDPAESTARSSFLRPALKPESQF